MPPLGLVKGNLRVLHLPSNCLIFIPTDYFCGFTHLRAISLDYNKLLALPNVTPLKATLGHLELDGNEIPSFEPFLLRVTFPLMRQLSLKSNNITYLSRDMISRWPKLIILYLQKNLLKSLEDLSGLIRLPSAPLTVWYFSYLTISMTPQLTKRCIRLVIPTHTHAQTHTHIYTYVYI